jgi:hypothetical protein
MGKWVFEELRGAAVRRDPQEAELFKTEQTAEGEYSGNDALVREILQNAVDARAADAPVRVRFAIHEATDAPPPVRLAYYFKRLREPLLGRSIAYGKNDAPALPCRFLVCEDFGTSGLEGDPALFHDPVVGNKTRQDFFWFWRNIGRSGKTGDDLGRWGLGKTVFRAVSRVGCMFGLTVRQSDQLPMLMGQTVLQIHTRDGLEYLPEGYWCGDQDATGLPIPINFPAELDEFSREWHLTRSSEPGLSVVSPFIPDEVKAHRLLEAVAVHFFTRILRGDLVVEVVGEGVGAVTLDKTGIEAACKKMQWNGPKRTKRHVAPPIAFAKTCLKTRPTLATPLLGTERLPDLNDPPPPPETLEPLRQRFAAGDLLAIRARIWLPRKSGKGEEGHADVYLQRRADGLRADSYYVREGMTITKINSRAAQRGIQALVIADPGALAELLGDTEGPAHEDWDTSAERPDREWKSWKGRVKFVRGIVDSLCELLTPSTTAPDFDLLSDVFSVDLNSGAQLQRRPGERTKDRPKFEPPPLVPKWYQIVAGAGGFAVSRTPQVPMPHNPSLLVSVAYDLPSGDPLRSWCLFDFVLGDGSGELVPSGKGLRARKLSGNQLQLVDLQDDFRLSVSGFDRHRDLFVRVEEASPEELTSD